MRRLLRWISIAFLVFLIFLLTLCMLLGWLVGRAMSSPLCSAWDVIIMVDQSGSVTRDIDPEGERWTLIHELINSLQSVSVLVRVALLTFETSAHEVVPLTPLMDFPKSDDLMRLISGLPSMGWSDFDKGLEMAQRSLSDQRCALLILVTDGVPQTAQARDPRLHFPALEAQLWNLKRMGVHVVLVQLVGSSEPRWEAFQKSKAFWKQMSAEGLVLWLELAGPEDRRRIVENIRGLLYSMVPSTPLPVFQPTIPASQMPAAPMPVTPSKGAPPDPTPPLIAPSEPVQLPEWRLPLLGIVLSMLSILWSIRRMRDRSELTGMLMVIEGPNGLAGRRWDLSRAQRSMLRLGEDLDPRLPKGVARLVARQDSTGHARVWLIPMQTPAQPILVRGKPVTWELPLRDQDEIQIGSCRLRFESLEERVLQLKFGEGG